VRKFRETKREREGGREREGDVEGEAAEEWSDFSVSETHNL